MFTLIAFSVLFLTIGAPILSMVFFFLSLIFVNIVLAMASAALKLTYLLIKNIIKAAILLIQVLFLIIKASLNSIIRLVRNVVPVVLFTCALCLIAFVFCVSCLYSALHWLARTIFHLCILTLFTIPKEACYFAASLLAYCFSAVFQGLQYGIITCAHALAEGISAIGSLGYKAITSTLEFIGQLGQSFAEFFGFRQAAPHPYPAAEAGDEPPPRYTPPAGFISNLFEQAEKLRVSFAEACGLKGRDLPPPPYEAKEEEEPGHFAHPFEAAGAEAAGAEGAVISQAAMVSGAN